MCSGRNPGTLLRVSPVDENFASSTLEAVNRLLAEGWSGQLAARAVEAGPDRLRLVCSVAERHLQPHGLVHGGVYASLVETACSLGAGLAAAPGETVVGLDNHTSFVRPVAAGELRVLAVCRHAGRRTKLWQCTITDQRERLVAEGQLRLMALASPAAEAPSRAP